MRFASMLIFGAALNLCLTFAPLGLMQRETPWLRPELLCVAIGLTCLLLADAARNSQIRCHSTTSADRQALGLAYVTGAAILLFVWCAEWEWSVAIGGPAAWQVAGGSMLLIAGATLRAAAIRQLGNQFVSEVTPMTRDTLVRSGIYAAVRHPSETGLLLSLSGIALTLNSTWATLAAIPTFATLTWLRLRLEEISLRSVFGESYREYCREVGGLWPKRRAE